MYPRNAILTVFTLVPWLLILDFLWLVLCFSDNFIVFETFFPSIKLLTFSNLVFDSAFHPTSHTTMFGDWGFLHYEAKSFTLTNSSNWISDSSISGNSRNIFDSIEFFCCIFLSGLTFILYLSICEFFFPFYYYFNLPCICVVFLI